MNAAVSFKRLQGELPWRDQSWWEPVYGLSGSRYQPNHSWTVTPDLWTPPHWNFCGFSSVSLFEPRWRGDSCWCPTPLCTAVVTWSTVSSTPPASLESKLAPRFIYVGQKVDKGDRKQEVGPKSSDMQRRKRKMKVFIFFILSVYWANVDYNCICIWFFVNPSTSRGVCRIFQGGGRVGWGVGMRGLEGKGNQNSWSEINML